MDHSQHHLSPAPKQAPADSGIFHQIGETFSQTGFMPHGHCYLWKPGLVSTHVISDTVIGCSYLSIALTLCILARKVRLPFSSMVLAFGTFIAACGAGHFMDMWNLWHADYWVSAWVKAITAIASVSTAVWFIRSRKEIRSFAEAAKLAIQKRLDLEALTKDLEKAIQERTLELEESRRIAQEQKEELRTITDALPSLVAYIDQNQRYRTVNAAFEKWFGVPTESIAGQSIEDFLGAEAYAELAPMVEKALAGEEQNFEADIPFVYGSQRRVRISYIPRRNAQGEPNGFFLLANDVTEQRKAHQDVVDSEHRLSLALDVSTMGIWEWHADTRKTLIDARAAKILGLREDIAHPAIEDFYQAIHPDDRDHVLNAFYTAIAANTKFRSEHRVVAPGGEIRWIFSKGRPEVDANQRTTRIIGVVMDITERKDAEEKLAAAILKAETANSAKSEFLANMSHEIRTPLGAVLGFTELLKDPSMSQEERAKYAEIIDRNGKQLSHLINDILDLSKVEAGKLEIEHTAVSLPSLIAETTSMLRALAMEKNINLRVKPWSNIPARVCTDPTRLNQILINVIGNAIKFTQQGEVSVAIETKRVLENGQSLIGIRVQDTGIGITSEQQAKLFHAFSQADSSMTRKFGGTGLGLILSKRLSEALGGDLTLVESRPEEGTVFEITILVAPPEICKHHPNSANESEPTSKPSRTVASETKSFHGVRLLVAEDSPDNKLLIERMLIPLGPTIEFAENGEDAVEKALNGDFDLVLMDIQMPVKNGYDATQLLRARGFQKPIVALTAHALVEERKRSLEVGCNDHVTKPLTRQKLYQTIEKYA
jgi:hypothetical protein